MQKRNRLFAIILAVFVMAVVAPMAFAADEVVTIDLANGNVTITETGYSIDGGAETAFTGDYVFTGKNDETKMADVIRINSLAEGTDITLKDVEIAQKGPACINSLVDLTLEATGSVKMSNSSPVINADGKNIVITGDADISLNSNVYLASVGTMDIACNRLEIVCKSSAPMVYGCSDFKVNAVKDVVLNGWFTPGNVEVTAGEDITIDNAKTTAPLLQATTSLKSTNGDITIDHKGMICTGASVVLDAAGDVTVNADTRSPANTSGNLTIAGNNVTLTNASGAIITGSIIDIDAKGNIVFEGSTSGAPVVSAGLIELNGADITFANKSTGAQLLNADKLTVEATGDFTAVGAANSKALIANSYGSIYFNIAADSVHIENTQVGTLINGNGPLNFNTNGDITLVAESSGTIMYADINATSENGTVTMTNKGSHFITSGNLVVDAKDIVLTVVGAGPITRYGYDLTAENDITISTGYSATTYNPIEPTAYDFGNKLTVTTSAGTTEHTHEYADVAYNNDATCEADGTKLVKCDCDWAKEKTVTAEGTKLDHVDADGDYKCDNGCGYEFEKPAEPETDCACGKEHKNFFDIIICFVKGVIDIISEMLLGE
ncbi:MAG: hypothetical protein IKB12_09085 [Clostridia bacterium]|nr:hypothetical protein [Clostridia bacterium]